MCFWTDVVQFEENIAAKLKTAGIVTGAERGNVGQTFEVTFDNFVLSSDLQLPVVGMPQSAVHVPLLYVSLNPFPHF